MTPTADAPLCPVWAANPISRLRWNGGFGAYSGPSRGDPGRRAIRPIATYPAQSAMSAIRVRRDKAALSSGCKPHPAIAPVGSNRSSHGGDEMAGAFGVAGHLGDGASVRAATRVNTEQSSERTSAGRPDNVIGEGFYGWVRSCKRRSNNPSLKRPDFPGAPPRHTSNYQFQPSGMHKQRPFATAWRPGETTPLAAFGSVPVRAPRAVLRERPRRQPPRHRDMDFRYRFSGV